MALGDDGSPRYLYRVPKLGYQTGGSSAPPLPRRIAQILFRRDAARRIISQRVIRIVVSAPQAILEAAPEAMVESAEQFRFAKNQGGLLERQNRETSPCSSPDPGTAVRALASP